MPRQRLLGPRKMRVIPPRDTNRRVKAKLMLGPFLSGEVATATAQTIDLPAGTRQVTFNSLEGDIYLRWGASAPADGARYYVANGTTNAIGCPVGTTQMSVMTVDPLATVPLDYSTSTVELRYFNPQVYYGDGSSVSDTGTQHDLTLTLGTSIAAYNMTIGCGTFRPTGAAGTAGLITPAVGTSNSDLYHLNQTGDPKTTLTHRASAANTNVVLGADNIDQTLDSFCFAGAWVDTSNWESYDTAGTPSVQTGTHSAGTFPTTFTHLRVGKVFNNQHTISSMYQTYPFIAKGWKPTLAQWNDLNTGGWPGRVAYGEDILGWILPDVNLGNLDGSGRGGTVAKNGSGTLTDFESVTETTGFEVPNHADTSVTLDADYNASYSNHTLPLVGGNHHGVYYLYAPHGVTVQFKDSGATVIPLAEVGDARAFTAGTTLRMLVPMNAVTVDIKSTSGETGTANIVGIRV